MSKVRSLLSGVAVIVLLMVLGGTLISLADSESRLDPVTFSGLGTAFTYQGYLSEGQNPANGLFDLTFSLYDDPEVGNQVGITISKTISLTDGLFSVELDFGSVLDGTALWLEIRVRPAGDTGPYSTLLPRQRLTPAPFATFATWAASTSWTGLTDLPAGFGDGVDDDTTYQAGVGLTLSDTIFAISSTYQLPQTCGISQTVKWNGSTWACGTDELGAGSSAWLLTGNADTSPGTDFLGTTDNQALEFHVNQSRVLRLEPNETSPTFSAATAATAPE